MEQEWPDVAGLYPGPEGPAGGLAKERLERRSTRRAARVEPEEGGFLPAVRVEQEGGSASRRRPEARAPPGAIAHRRGAPVWSATRRTSASSDRGRWRARRGGLRDAASARRASRASSAGRHQVAQNSTSTGRPARSSRATGRPESSVRVNAGSVGAPAVPRRGERRPRRRRGGPRGSGRQRGRGPRGSAPGPRRLDRRVAALVRPLALAVESRSLRVATRTSFTKMTG